MEINRNVTRAGTEIDLIAAVGAVVRPTVWPADPDHREAIDTLLVMAEAEQRWGESDRALDLLSGAERIIGALPEPYARLRRRCATASRRP